MADIAFRSSTTLDSSNPASITPSKPAGTLSTDTVVFYVCVGVGSGGTCATWTGATGWTGMSGSPFAFNDASFGNYLLHLWTAPGSVVFSNAFSKAGGSGTQFVGGVCASFSGADSTPVNVIATGLATGNNIRSLSVPAVITTRDRCLSLIVCTDSLDGQITATGYTKIENAAVNQSAALLYATAVTTPQGSTGAVTVNDSAASSGNAMAALQLALQPPASGGSASLFRPSLLNGLGDGGPFFNNPLGRTVQKLGKLFVPGRPDRRIIVPVLKPCFA